MAISSAGKMVENFDSIDSKEEIDVVKIKNRRIEKTSLDTNNLAIIMAFKNDTIYIRHQVKTGFTEGIKREHLEVPANKVDWSNIYISEEDDKSKNDLMTGAAYWGTGNAMQSFDYSRLFVSLPFENPETGDHEELEFVLKNDNRMKNVQRFLEKNKQRIQNAEEETEEVDESPLEILKKRFAKGEISEEEFEKKKEMLE